MSNDIMSALLGHLKLVLGSHSPRRINLLKDMGLVFESRTPEVEESYPDELPKHEVPLYLSKLKAEALRPRLGADELMLTADTIVLIDGDVIGKPGTQEKAHDLLARLSGRTHTVISGYTLVDAHGHSLSGTAETKVTFTHLSEEEISYYLDRYEVLDKAGAYGVQDWIGLIGVERIEGSYHNIMGLPTMRIYRDLKQFVHQLDGHRRE